LRRKLNTVTVRKSPFLQAWFCISAPNNHMSKGLEGRERADHHRTFQSSVGAQKEQIDGGGKQH
jgi:hypothetical protein